MVLWVTFFTGLICRKIWYSFKPRKGTVSGITKDGNCSLVACYQDVQITCNILNNSENLVKQPEYLVNQKNLDNDTVDLWSLGYVRFESDTNSHEIVKRESQEWKTVTSFKSKKYKNSILNLQYAIC